MSYLDIMYIPILLVSTLLLRLRGKRLVGVVPSFT